MVNYNNTNCRNGQKAWGNRCMCLSQPQNQSVLPGSNLLYPYSSTLSSQTPHVSSSSKWQTGEVTSSSLPAAWWRQQVTHPLLSTTRLDADATWELSLRRVSIPVGFSLQIVLLVQMEVSLFCAAVTAQQAALRLIKPPLMERVTPLQEEEAALSWRWRRESGRCQDKKKTSSPVSLLVPKQSVASCCHPGSCATRPPSRSACQYSSLFSSCVQSMPLSARSAPRRDGQWCDYGPGRITWQRRSSFACARAVWLCVRHGTTACCREKKSFIAGRQLDTIKTWTAPQVRPGYCNNTTWQSRHKHSVSR